MELVEAEKKSKSIVQVGMQRRSYDLYQEGRDIVAAGTLGNVRMVRSWWLNNYLRDGAGHEARRAARLGAMAGTGSASVRSTRPLPAVALLLRLLRRHCGGPGRARLRRHPHADGRGLSAGGECLGGQAASRRVSIQPESVVAIAEYPEDFIGVFIVNYAAMHYQSRNDQLNQLDGDRRGWISGARS